MVTVIAGVCSRDSFEEEDTLLEHLGRQLLGGRLALVLGAGISMPFNLPKWSDLLERMFVAVGTKPPEMSLEAQAEFLKNKYFPSDERGFRRAIHDALYRDVSASFQELHQNLTLAAIGALVMASQRGTVANVVTFNFDDLLEIFLEYHGLITSSIAENSSWSSSADVQIFHPHGMIPLEDSREASQRLIFDQESYSGIVGQDSDPWRQRLLPIFSTHTCLFIGVSGNDTNLDSLLLAARDRHPYKRENVAFWGITFSDRDDEPSQLRWEKRGIFYKKVSDYTQDLPRFIFRIAQRAAKLRKADK